jgi:hypothetical protein
LGWVDAQNLATGDTLSYMRKFKLINLARVQIAGYKSDGEGHHD